MTLTKETLTGLKNLCKSHAKHQILGKHPKLASDAYYSDSKRHLSQDTSSMHDNDTAVKRCSINSTMITVS